MITRRTLLKHSLMAACAAAFPHAAVRAQSWPNRPVRCIVPLPPGGVSDYFARAIGEPLGRRWGQPLVVENRSGADGRIGVAALARQPADGHSIGIISVTQAIQPSLFKDIPYDILKDFEPVGLIAQAPFILVTGPALAGISSVKELIDFARKNPGKVTFGSSGNGTPFHLGGELLKVSTGVDMLHVPYRGSAPLITALLGGEVSFGVVSVGPFLPHITAGKLKVLATTLESGRLPVLPQVPTLNEALGMNDLVVLGWQGIIAPGGTPKPIVERLNADLRAVLGDPQFVREKVESEGYTANPLTPAQMTELMRRDIDKYAKVVREAKVSVE